MKNLVEQIREVSNSWTHIGTDAHDQFESLAVQSVLKLCDAIDIYSRCGYACYCFRDHVCDGCINQNKIAELLKVEG